jgi:UDP-2-acetamido-3-amino-2,3-dideoxy-glucuronate N-acetyltransferase
MEQGKPYIHPSSFVDEQVTIGAGTQIWHFCHISGGTKIGAKCKIGQNVFVDKNVTIGDNCKIQNNVSVYRGVVLENDVFCGPSMVFTNVFNPRSAYPRQESEFRQTLVKRGASIGANATIVCGHTIGAWAFVGAGSVVTTDVPNYALVYGNPAKIRGWFCECGEKLVFQEDNALCPKCQVQYKKNKMQITKIEK